MKSKKLKTYRCEVCKKTLTASQARKCVVINGKLIEKQHIK